MRFFLPFFLDEYVLVLSVSLSVKNVQETYSTDGESRYNRVRKKDLKKGRVSFFYLEIVSLTERIRCCEIKPIESQKGG